jgi:DNA-binding transcriptional MerR regulator
MFLRRAMKKSRKMLTAMAAHDTITVTATVMEKKIESKPQTSTLPKGTPSEPASVAKTGPQAEALPDWALHISEVYKWAERPRHFGSKLTKRTIQWYSSSGLLPSPQRFGKEAYYNRHTIFSYLRVIEILNRKFGLLLSEIHKIIRKAETLDTVDADCICVGVDGEGEPILEYPVVVLSTLLEEFLEYEGIEASKCDSTMDGPDFSSEQINRLDAISGAIMKGLRSNKKEFQQVISSGIIKLEGKLFPKGKVAVDGKPGPSDMEEVPF